MIPLRDHNPSGRLPFVNYALIAANVYVFIRMLFMPASALDTFIANYSLTPNLVSQGERLYTIVTSMFLHAGFLHIGGNMLFLYIFGDNLEDRLGHIKYLLYYFFCGIVAALSQIAIDPTSTLPTLGASGAIAGVMGGYLLLFPRHRIDILFTLGLFFQTVTIPAYFMLFYWFAFQLIVGTGSLSAMNQGLGGVAYFAHIGGFAAGFLSLVPFRRQLLHHQFKLS